MKILTIGQTLLDTIEYNDMQEKKPGGIYYTIASLLALKENEDEIFLISEVPIENYESISFFYDNINTSFCKKIQKPREVFLKVESNGERIECFNFRPESLSIPDINFNDFDGILINMITGFEISFEDLKRIRDKYYGIIYFDLHSLSRMEWDGSKRKYSTVKNIDKWLESIDILQCSLLESKTLFGDLPEKEIAQKALDLGLSSIIITKGGEGVSCYFYENDELSSVYFPAEKIEAKNHVGLGDGFGAAFFYYYLKYGSLALALSAGNSFAAALAQNFDLKSPEHLKDYVNSKLL